MKWGIERSGVLTRMAELPGCGSFINHQYDRYLRLKFQTNWRLIRNPASHRSFANAELLLNPKQQQILLELNKNGVAVCHINDLFQDRGVWFGLSEQLKAFSQSEAIRSGLRERQKAFEEAKDPNAVGHYILTYYAQDKKSSVEASNPLFELATSSQILDVVNSYLGMWSKLIYFDLWHTVPLMTDTRILSQRWHRDPEDCKKIRIFLYYNPVNEDSGAMEYFAGSQMGGPYQDLFPWRDPLTTPYPPDGVVDEIIPASRHVFLEGPPGTLIFCDTAGLHRGGTAKNRPRILATAAYVTPASLHGRRYEISDQLRTAQESSRARFAVT